MPAFAQNRYRPTAHSQRGITLTGLIFWGAIVAALVLLGGKIAPEYMQYNTINRTIKTVAKDVESTTAMGDIRANYSRRAGVENISRVSAQDLAITQSANGKYTIAFAYDVEIPLIANVSLKLAFEGSADSGKP